MKNKKVIIISLIVIIWLLSITYAWFSWTSSNNTNVSFDINGITVTYNGGDNISGVKLIPVTDRAAGVTAGTAIEKTITAQASTNNTYMNLYLDVELLDAGLKQNTFKWEVKKGNTTLGSGDFANANVNDTITLFSDEEITTTTSTYKLYIWIDGTVDNPETMENQNFKFVLHADATDQKPVYASEKIIKLAGNCTSYTSGFEGICATNPYEVNGETKYHEYRYIGGEVNNFVKFNDDMYRIIGAFDKNSYDIESVENNDYGDYLVKLISANILTSTAWGTSNAASEYTTYSVSKSNWDGLDSNGTTTNGTGVPANANVLLNEFFLNPTRTSIYGECTNWTYVDSNDTYKSKNCTNIKGYGIQTEALRNYIEPVTWYLYGYTAASLTRANWYQCERNNYDGCSSANSGAYSGTAKNNIGLMYVSDYLHASGYIASDATMTGASSNYINLNWLYNGMEWTITPDIDSDIKIIKVNLTGNLSSDSVSKGMAIRPTFYLKSTIKIKSGDGTFENPYIISL